MIMSKNSEIDSVEAVQNPALCAALIWSFGRGYRQANSSKLPIIHFVFLVLPLILHRPTLEQLTSTNTSSGFGKFVEKMSHRHREELLAIHPRALLMRRLTLQGISTGIATGLLAVIYDDGTIRANEVSLKQQLTRIRKMMDAAYKLGDWLARVPNATVFSLLKVIP
jgi:Family of unknown function (DUF6521)